MREPPETVRDKAFAPRSRGASDQFRPMVRLTTLTPRQGAGIVTPLEGPETGERAMSKWILAAIVFGLVACEESGGRGIGVCGTDDVTGSFCERYVAALNAAAEAADDCSGPVPNTPSVEQCEAMPLPEPCDNPSDQDARVEKARCSAKLCKCIPAAEDAWFDAAEACAASIPYSAACTQYYDPR